MNEPKKISPLSNESLLSRWPHRQALLEETRRRSGDTVLLGFSRGKDAIAAWLYLRDSGLFKRIIPIHLNPCPGLKFVRESLDYFEDVFHTHIIDLPHPSVYEQLKNGMFQPPGRLQACIDWFGNIKIHAKFFEDAIREYNNLPSSTLKVTGVRAYDSIRRRMSLNRHGPFGPDNVKLIWDWTTAETYGIIRRNHIKLPVDYLMFGRSFDGLNYYYIKPIKDRFPEDYERIKKWFPLIDLEIMRFETLENRAENFLKAPAYPKDLVS